VQAQNQNLLEVQENERLGIPAPRSVKFLSPINFAQDRLQTLKAKNYKVKSVDRVVSKYDKMQRV